MAKRKKTRQEKIKADFRHELPQISLYDVGQITEEIQQMPRKSVSQVASLNTYFVKDLQKTLLLTFSILISQIALFFFLQNHIIKLPFISY